MGVKSSVWVGAAMVGLVAGAAHAAPDSGLPAADAMAPVDSGPGSGTLPCNLRTGFDGDESCILPPAGGGFQLHFGPTNYDDPVAVAPFTAAPGDEQDRCLFMHTPNAAPVDARELHFRSRPGLYDGAVTFLSKDRADSTAPEPCDSAPGTPWLTFNRVSEDSSLGSGAPENQRLTWLVPAHAAVAFRYHHLNVTDKPLLDEAWVNVIAAPSGGVETVATLRLHGRADAVAPGSAISNHFHCAAPGAIRVVQLMAALSAAVTEFSAYVVRASGTKELVYSTYDWREPPLLNYDSVTTNLKPDPVTKTAGGSSGILNLSAGDSLEWDCSVSNATNVSLSFQPGPIFTSVTCDLLGVYVPAGAEPWTCTSDIRTTDGGVIPIGPNGTGGSGGSGTANASGGRAAAGGGPSAESDAGTRGRTVSKTEGGCGCRVLCTAGESPESEIGFVGAALALIGLRRRRMGRGARGARGTPISLPPAALLARKVEPT